MKFVKNVRNYRTVAEQNGSGRDHSLLSGLIHRRRLLATAGAISAAAIIPARAEAKYTLRLASWGTPKAPQVVEFTSAFQAAVEKGSDGRIAVQTFPAGSLVNEHAVPSALQAHVVDISLFTMGNWASIVPTAGALTTVFFRPTAENFEKVIGPGSTLFHALDEDMSKHGVRLLATLYAGPLIVASRNPIDSPAAFRGKTVRVYDRLTAEIVQALGGAPSTIGVVDVYPALQRGTVQAAIGGLEGAIGFKEYEVAKYLLATNGVFGLLVTGYAMNRQALEGLPADLQKVVLNSGYSASEVTTRAMIAAYDRDLQQMRQHGMIITKLEPGTPRYKEFSDALGPLAKTQESRFPKDLVREIINAQG